VTEVSVVHPWWKFQTNTKHTYDCKCPRELSMTSSFVKVLVSIYTDLHG